MEIKVGDWVKIVNPRWPDNKVNIEMKNRIVKIEKIEGNFFISICKGKRKVMIRSEFELHNPTLKKFIEEMENVKKV